MWSSGLPRIICGSCSLDVSIHGDTSKDVRFSVMDDLCSDVLFGQDFLKLHQELILQLEGPNPPLTVGGTMASSLEPPVVSVILAPDCKAIATKSRRKSSDDQKFIGEEVRNLLEDVTVESSHSTIGHRKWW